MSDYCWYIFVIRSVEKIRCGSHTYVDLTLFDMNDFPALELLKDFSPLEVLLLAELVFNSDFARSKDASWYDWTDLLDVFENYDCTEDDMMNGVANLLLKDWVAVDYTDRFIVRANLHQLKLDGLYYRTVWHSVRHLDFPHLCGN